MPSFRTGACTRSTEDFLNKETAPKRALIDRIA